MKEAKRLLENLNKFNLNDVFFALWKRNDVQDLIIELNTKGEPTSQLYELGQDALGVSLGEYAPSTIEGTSNFEGKKSKGQRYDHITLNDSGSFYDSFKVNPTNRGYKITVNADKGDNDLIQDFGVEIVGLSKSNIDILLSTDWVKKAFNDEFARRLLQ